MSKTPDLNRRDFLRHSAGGGFALGSLLSLGLDLQAAQQEARRFKFANTREVPSVCPYCAVGCGQLIYAKDNKIIDIEGNPDTPHTLGRLCPKGAATIQLSNNPLRPTKGLYRAPGSDKWEEKPIEWMYDQIAKRYRDTREKYFIEKEKDGDFVCFDSDPLTGTAKVRMVIVNGEVVYDADKDQ